jgi:hypothetical protein
MLGSTNEGIVLDDCRKGVCLVKGVWRRTGALVAARRARAAAVRYMARNNCIARLSPSQGRLDFVEDGR